MSSRRSFEPGHAHAHREARREVVLQRLDGRGWSRRRRAGPSGARAARRAAGTRRRGRARAAGGPAGACGSSPISSRNSVAAVRLADQPGRSGHAGVGVVPGRAEQLGVDQPLGERRRVARDELAPRGARDSAWMARAASSLPAPLSPRTSTWFAGLRGERERAAQLPHGAALADDAVRVGVAEREPRRFRERRDRLRLRRRRTTNSTRALCSVSVSPAFTRPCARGHAVDC